jgi:hypothetical protein
MECVCLVLVLIAGAILYSWGSQWMKDAPK